MKSKLTSLLIVASLALGITGIAVAGPGPQFWQNVNTAEQFKKLKPGDKIAYVCNVCKTVSEVTVESSEQAMEHCKEGATLTCPSCKMNFKVTLKGGRNDPPIQREIIYTNDKGEECLFVVKASEHK